MLPVTQTVLESTSGWNIFCLFLFLFLSCCFRRGKCWKKQPDKSHSGRETSSIFLTEHNFHAMWIEVRRGKKNCGAPQRHRFENRPNIDHISWESNRIFREKLSPADLTFCPREGCRPWERYNLQKGWNLLASSIVEGKYSVNR